MKYKRKSVLPPTAERDKIEHEITVTDEKIDDEKGNTLFVRFSEKKEAFCKESEMGKEIIYSIAEDGSIIGLEILNYLARGERKPLKDLPVKTHIRRAS